MKTIGAKDLPDYVRGRMGIIIGPDISLEPGVYGSLSVHLATTFAVSQGANYLETADRALDSGASDSVVAEEIRRFIAACNPQSAISNLSKMKYASILSACLDTHFEDRVVQNLSRNSVLRTLTTIADVTDACPPKSIPSFKLLGMAARAGFAICTADYSTRRARWPNFTKQFADRVRGAAVLCLGMNGCKWILYDVLSAMVGEETGAPKVVVFLSDDPLASDTQIGRILKGRSEIIVLNASISDVLRAVEEMERNSYAPLLPLGESNEPIERLLRYRECIDYLGNHAKPAIPRHERNMLLDILFSPSVPRWDPYAYDLDFRRTANTNAFKNIEALLKPTGNSFESQVFCILGSAAVGKSVLLKRLTYDLAKAGHQVFQVKPYWLDSGQLFNDFFSELSKLQDFKGKPIILCVDDPIRMGTVSIAQLVECAKANKVEILLLVGCRSSDWENHEREEFTGKLRKCVTLELTDSLTADEIIRLPEYLCQVGVATDVESAKAQIRVQSKARDWLGMLFWLIPNTKYSITSSIRDEYFRLGNAVSLTQVIVAKARECAPILQRAYSMVAIADYYGAPIPIEVLVSALKVDFGVWQDAISGSGWGILYEVESEGNTIMYKTRNSIVSDTIREVVNSGIVSRSGEVAILNEILSGCKGTTPAYREFAIKILVHNSVFENLTYEDGMRLFQAATNAIRVPEKTILHHMARWMKNKGQDPIHAYEVLKQALAARPIPYVSTEPDEHIHTTMAATVLDAVDQRKYDIKEGTKIALEHLGKSRNANFFNPKAVHVQAGIVLKIIRSDVAQSKNDLFTLINIASTDIDRCLLHLEGLDHIDDVSVELLQQAKDTIQMAIKNPETIKDDAERLWLDHQSQEGFILEVRRLYKSACDQNKGSKFSDALTICDGFIKKVEHAGVPVAPRLWEVALHIVYRWQVKRAILRSDSSAEIRWGRIDEICNNLMRSKDYKDDAFYLYIHAICQAHLNKWAEAFALFGILRNKRISKEVLWMPRDFLYNPTGGLRQIQGVIRESVGRQLLAVEDLKTDFILSTRSKWPRANEIAHAYIQFSFGGALAIDLNSV